ncbi:MAG: TonB-dependent receptor [Chitinophagales bacterium]
MKKTLFFLLLVNTALAQTDSLPNRQKNRMDTASAVSGVVSSYSLQEVSITTIRATTNTPMASQLISKQELEKNNLGQDLPYLLDNTASVVTTSDAGAGVGYTGIRIRGSDNTRVNVTMNGIPVNDAESQGTYWVDIPDVVSSAQNVQIQRGVGTSTNGPGAFGGTVSVQTQTPAQKAYGAAGISLGSFSTFKYSARGSSGMLWNHVFVEGAASWITSKGYIDRAASNLQSYFAQVGFMSANTLIKFVYFGGREKTYQAWNGVPQDSLATNRTFNDLGTDYGQHLPAYKNQTDNYRQHYMQLLYSQNLGYGLFLNLGGFATLGKGYYEEFKAGTDITNYFPDLNSVTTDLARQKWLDNIFYGGTYSLNYKRGNWDVALGGLIGQYRGKHYGKVVWAQEIKDLDKNRHYYDGRSIKNDFNVYAKASYELLNKVVFFADMQYRYVSHTTSGMDNSLTPYNISRTWHFFNPKAGVTYKINYLNQVYASFALGNREPNRDDLMAATTTLPVKPETLRDVEAGYKGIINVGNHNIQLQPNFFFMHYKNQLVLTGRLNDVGNPIKANVPVSYRTGIELCGSFNFFARQKGTKAEDLRDVITANSTQTLVVTAQKVFAINFAFTWSMNKIKSFDEYIYTYDENYSPVDSLTMVINHKNTDISFSPSYIASLELVAYPVKGLSISLMNKAVSKQYLDNTSNEDRKLKTFYYTNLNISYSLPIGRNDREITFKVLLNNIFNRLYESNGYTYSERYTYPDGNGGQVLDGPYTYNYYYPQAGFNWLAGVNIRF